MKAVCLLSGGLDSTTVLYYALHKGYRPAALTLHYGQLHHKEIDFAKRIASRLGIAHFIIPISLPWGGSSLIDKSIPLPKNRLPTSEVGNRLMKIPSTYVPFRNSIFLSFAVSAAEALKADRVFIGANALDYSGYPDCRPEYFRAFEKTIAAGTKAGVEGKRIKIEAPLLRMSKKQIVLLGRKLGVPFEKTWSCYQGGKNPCGVCDSCQLRAKGFQEAGVNDSLMKIRNSKHEIRGKFEIRKNK